MNIVSKIKIGIQYMNDWPLEPLLNPVFPECRVKKAVIAGRKILPPFIVFILFWAVYQGGGFKGIPLLFAISSKYPFKVNPFVSISLNFKMKDDMVGTSALNAVDIPLTAIEPNANAPITLLNGIASIALTIYLIGIRIAFIIGS